MSNSSFAQLIGDEMSVYKALMQNILTAIKVSMPGQIVSFNAASQTATVKPMISDTVIIGGEKKAVPLPIIPDVPVSFPRGGDYAVTLPIRAGDACILVFSDSCIDGFCQSGTDSPQAEVRHHDISDAMAIVGISTGNAPIADYDPENLVVRHLSEDISIKLSADNLDIKYKESTIKMEESKITIKSGQVDVNGTVF